jgi:transcription antitermination factor NusG
VTPVHDYPWYAVRVRSNFEKTAAEFLEAREHDVFLPVYAARRRWADRVKEVKVPLFPGYVFCRFDAARPLPVLMAPGVVHIVSAGTQPVAVDPEELAAVRRMVEGSNAQPWPFSACRRAGPHHPGAAGGTRRNPGRGEEPVADHRFGHAVAAVGGRRN